MKAKQGHNIVLRHFLTEFVEFLGLELSDNLVVLVDILHVGLQQNILVSPKVHDVFQLAG